MDTLFPDAELFRLAVGRGSVERLQQDGYEVVILDRVAPEPATAARWIEVDLMDGEATDAAVREALADGPIARVVHNVGHVRPNLLEDTYRKSTRLNSSH